MPEPVGVSPRSLLRAAELDSGDLRPRLGYAARNFRPVSPVVVENRCKVADGPRVRRRVAPNVVELVDRPTR